MGASSCSEKARYSDDASSGPPSASFGFHDAVAPRTRGGTVRCSDPVARVGYLCTDVNPPIQSKSLDELLRNLESAASELVAKYREMQKVDKSRHHGASEPAPEPESQPRRAFSVEELSATEHSIKRVNQSLSGLEKWCMKSRRRIARTTYTRGSMSRHVSQPVFEDLEEDAELWGEVYGEAKKRCLREMAIRVQVESRVIKHWRNALLPRASARSIGYVESKLANVSGGTLRRVEATINDLSIDTFKLHESTKNSLLVAVASIWRGMDMSELCSTKDEEISEYFRELERGYKNIPYHNSMHSAETLATMHYLMSHMSTQSNFNGYFNKVDHLVAIVATSAHDVGHVGFGNDFLVKTQHELALRYNDKSVLENMHAATSFELMKRLKVDVLAHKLPSPPASALRRRVVDMILATDMSVHAQNLQAFQDEIEEHHNYQDIDKIVLEQNLLHFSDIGHPFRSFDIHNAWCTRITDEFFTQGDQEKELGMQPLALFDREKAPPFAKGQLGFLTFVIAPTLDIFIQVLGPCGELFKEHFQRNVAKWETLEKASNRQSKALEVSK
eukprot:TRINITY_DN60838_c0_g1_i1.p1 TRINITY_DN60838_c0_g1~~TRINITY_DN60838_c0_g1_i1.p1  ORF type:complete len:582 (+),score=87.17 TRINITY_DN60838_c0_g1_i1:69-1748(+)